MAVTQHDEAVLRLIRAALHSEPRLAGSTRAIEIGFADSTAVLEGEVPTVAAKKCALERVAAISEVAGIVDRLHVAPAERMGDGEIRDLVREALIQEPALEDIGIAEHVKGRTVTARAVPVSRRGEIVIEIEDGVVTLTGEVPGLGLKRLAGVLAWWVPGARDVVNGLAVEPPEADNEGEVADAVHIALEKDVFVNASQVRVFVDGRKVTLTGIVPTESEREMAEADAWYVFGVDRVENRIEVRA